MKLLAFVLFGIIPLPLSFSHARAVVLIIGYFLTGLGALKILNLGFNDITDDCLGHLKGGFTLPSDFFKNPF